MLNTDTIYGFVTTILQSRFDSPKPIPDFHKELWELCTSEEKQVAIAAPRAHAKSTSITHSYVLAKMLFRESSYCLIVSDTEGQAIQFLGDIKKELVENDLLRETFGITLTRGKLTKDTESVAICTFEDGQQFRIEAKGSEQKVRGLKWRSLRPDLIIGDDLENDEVVLNEERRFKFRQWFFNALIPCGSDECLIRIVGTILHMDSMLERLMPAWGDKDTQTDGLKFWTTQKRSWKSVRYQAHNSDFSQMLWPEKFSKDRLERIRATYVEQGFPEGYSQEYLNYPIDEENAFFRKEDFPPIQDTEENVEYYVGGDLAISEKDRRAYSVFVVAALGSSGKLKVVEVVRQRMDSLEIIEEVFRLHAKFHPVAFFIEKENIARSIGPMLNLTMRQRNIYPNIGDDTMIVPSQDKEKRAQAIRARARAGGVEINHDAWWFDLFITELIQFPRPR